MTSVDCDQVVTETNILTVAASVFIMEDGTEAVQTMKSKALNICANLAMASTETIQEMMQPKYGIMAQV